MNWEDERYVRLFVRDTGDWCALSWDGQALLMQLLRKADRSGVIQLGKRGRAALPFMLFHPGEATRIDVALAELTADGCVELHGNYLAIPNFTKAQETKQNDRQRQADSREKRLAQARQEPVIAATNVSHAVTDGHTLSHDVTLAVPSVPSHAVPSHAVPNQPIKTINAPRVGVQMEISGGADLDPGQPDLFPDAQKPATAQAARVSGHPGKPTAAQITATATILLGELSAARIRVDKKCRPLEPCASNLDGIRARLKDRHSAEDIRHVIAVCEAKSMHDANTREYFNASNPFTKAWMSRYLAMTIEQARRPVDGRAAQRILGSDQSAEAARRTDEEGSDYAASMRRLEESYRG